MSGTRRWRLGVPASRLLAVVTLAGAFLGVVALRPGSAVPACATPLVQVRSVTAVGERHEIVVYRPPVPDSAQLPVVYFLHGLPGAAGDAIREGLVDEAAQLAAHGHPFVLVAPDGNGSRQDTEWADAKDGRDRLESFIVNGVIPAVEGAHRRPKDRRAILGFSMGGYGAANIALRHPAVFGVFGSVSGYFTIDDPDGVFGSDPADEAANQPDDETAAARGMRVLLVEGAQDPLSLIHGQAAPMAALLRAAGASVTLHVVPGGHDWRLVRLALPELVTRLLPSVPARSATATPSSRATRSPSAAPAPAVPRPTHAPACGSIDTGVRRSAGG